MRECCQKILYRGECIPLQRSYDTPWRLIGPRFDHRNSTVIITSQEEKRLTISFRSRLSLSRSAFSCSGYRWLEVFVSESLSPFHFCIMFSQKIFRPSGKGSSTRRSLQYVKSWFPNNQKSAQHAKNAELVKDIFLTKNTLQL